MDRDEFMELVYETFADEPDNVLANGIIEAADAYVEHEKAQHSQEGTTSDTISRQAAIDGLSGHYIERINLNDWQAGWNAALDWLESAYLDGLPSAQPERAEGEWVQVSAQKYFTSASYFYRCSVCGENNPRNTKYCPNCGADMRGEKNE